MTKITVEIDGQTYVADSSQPGTCATCDLRHLASYGKQCRWSMVCGYHVTGANFKRLPNNNNNISKYYEEHRYTGD